MLNERVLKILQSKEGLRLHENRLVAENADLIEKLHQPAYTDLITRLFEEAVTVYRDEGLPSPGEEIVYLQVGKEEISPFCTDLQESFEVTPLLYEPGLSLKGYDQIILALYQLEVPEELQALQATTVVFTSPYVLKDCPQKGTVIVGYEGVREAEKAVSKVIKRETKPLGKLPLDCSTLR